MSGWRMYVGLIAVGLFAGCQASVGLHGRIVSYDSRQLQGAELNYSVNGQERSQTLSKGGAFQLLLRRVELPATLSILGIDGELDSVMPNAEYRIEDLRTRTVETGNVYIFHNVKLGQLPDQAKLSDVWISWTSDVSLAKSFTVSISVSSENEDYYRELPLMLLGDQPTGKVRLADLPDMTEAVRTSLIGKSLIIRVYGMTDAKGKGTKITASLDYPLGLSE